MGCGEALPCSMRNCVTDDHKPCFMAYWTRRPCQLDAPGSGTAGRDSAVVGNAEAGVPPGIWGGCDRYPGDWWVGLPGTIPGRGARCADAVGRGSSGSLRFATRTLLPLGAGRTCSSYRPYLARG